MPIAFVQSANVDGGTAVAFPSNITTGNSIIVAIRLGDATSVPVVTDTGLNTYVEDRRQVVGGNRAFIFSAHNISGGIANTVTSTVTGRIAIHEYSGLAASATLDQVNSATGTGTSANSGNVTTTQANELLFGAGATSGIASFFAGTNYTLREKVPATNSRLATEDRIVSTTGTYSASFTFGATEDWACLIATYKAPAAGVVPPAILTGPLSSNLRW